MEIIPCRGLNRSLPKDVDLWEGQLTAAHVFDVWTYLNDIPYWCTASNPDFHTNVTSQALVA